MNDMDLRDYFAVKANEKDIQKYQRRALDNIGYVMAWEEVMTREQAKYAYADAMMKAREK